MGSKQNYIPALDGLRAISIFLVLVFHLNESYIPGGFIGVDIFFVISGYIISKNILKERENKSFQFKSFYWRRAARLMPAAVVTAAVTYIATVYIFGIDKTFDLTTSFLTSTFWTSNIYFFFNSGYFDPVSSNNPFLHYWSLSVEEQFYFIWPALIVFIVGAKIYRYAVLLVAAIALSAFVYVSDPQAMFYLMPARVFQFAAGALIACAHYYRQDFFDTRSLLGAAAGIAGLIVITASAVFASGEDYNFLIAALLPTLGASLLILFVSSEPMTRTIGTSWFTWVGKRAYSLYLVHWPIMVFASFYLGPNRAPFVDGMALLACFAAASFLYNQIESPLRHIGRSSTSKYGKPLVVGLATVGAIALGSLAFPYLHLVWDRPDNREPLVASTDEAPTTETPTGIVAATLTDAEFRVRDYAALAAEISAGRYRQGRIARGCHLPFDAPFERFLADACLPATPDGRKIMLIGDSYGAETIPLLETWLPTDQLITAVSGGCLPIYPETGLASRPESCQQLNRFRYEQLAERQDVTAVVLVSNWRHWRPRNIESTIEYITSLGRQVFVVGARPQFSESIPGLLDSPIGSQIYQDLSRYHTYEPQEKNTLLQQIVERYEDAYLIDVLPSFCPDACPAFFGDNQLIYMDAAHTGPDFAQTIAQQVEQNQPEIVAALQASISAHETSNEPALEDTATATLDLRLECDAINADLPAATRRFEAPLNNGTFSVRLGTAAGDRFEHWDGQIDTDGGLLVEGEYIEGAGGIKPIHLEGTYSPGDLSASGNRGIRRCDLYID